MIGFTVLGAASSLFKKDTAEDYLLAGRSIPPWLAALSAVATMNSGFMFVGQIGFTYRVGIQSIWMLVGWTIGDYLAWRIFFGRLRRLSQERGEISAVALLRPPDGLPYRVLVPLAGVATVVFLGIYSAAQLKAGSTALTVLFGWPHWLGAVLGAIMVAIYCFSGGLRASIWTDAAQSVVMIVSMFLLVATAWMSVGGPAQLFEVLRAQDPSLLHVIPEDLRFGFGIYLLGMVFGGFGVIGQPQILVRSMTVERPEDVARARRVYFSWLIPFYVFAIGVGLHARALMPELGSVTDAMAGLSPESVQQAIQVRTEQALPALAQKLLPDVLVGLMLAALFSATMSTADSLIIACTTAVTQDILPRFKKSIVASKVSTLSITLFALAVALYAGSGVFVLVLVAWSALACIIGPVLILRLLKIPASRTVSVAMMVAGCATVIYWHNSRYNDDVFKLLPGMAAAFGVYLLVRLASRFKSGSSGRVKLKGA